MIQHRGGGSKHVDFNFFKRKQPLGARQSQRAALAARLADAELAVAEAQRAATEAALEGRDDTALDKAEAHTRAAAHRVTTLTEAIAALDAEIEAQAAKELAEADQKQRAATARVIHKLAAEIEDSLPDIVTALRRGHAAIEAGRFCFGDIGLFKLLDELESSLPTSFAILASEMRGRAEETIARRVPAGLPVPEPVIPPAPLIPRTRVFALQNLKWTDPETHRLTLCERFDVCALPNIFAELAISKDLAIDPELDRARELIKQRRGAPPLQERCYDLDLGGEAPKSRSQIPWNLEVINRGPPQRMSLAPPATLEPMAARSAPVQDNGHNDEK
jgi:hypothetical protein